MLDVKTLVVTTLKADAQLVALLGSTDKIFFAYPDTFNKVPLVTYREDNQADRDFADDAPFGFDSIIVIDIYTPATSTTSIAKRVDVVMHNLGFTVEFSSDVPEPDTKYRHRNSRYRRVFTAGDL